MKITKKLTKFKLYCILYWNLLFQKTDETANYIYESDDFLENEEDLIDFTEEKYFDDEKDSSSR